MHLIRKKSNEANKYKRQHICIAVYILFCLFSFNTNMMSQTQTVDLSFKDTRVQDVIKAISRQSGVSIIYSDSYFEGMAPVSIETKGENIIDVLQQNT